MYMVPYRHLTGNYHALPYPHHHPHHLPHALPQQLCIDMSKGTEISKTACPSKNDIISVLSLFLTL